ncbi:hypothetical protein A0H81_11550 [Grifola frondosa]|uniref:Uncharacterized protein n=1 Tax=Grifola frondosa TaxID=5627 RepID=A0A1C7LUY1_GRIFR|nr:hypothetical protein A0H81_11550 [Grifola frondosa]
MYAFLYTCLFETRPLRCNATSQVFTYRTQALDYQNMRNLGLAVLYLCLSVMSSFPQARANTEIVNFAASPGRDVSLPLIDWPVLRYGAAESLWKVQPAPLHTPLASVCAQGSGFPTKSCPNEIWVILDLDNPEWESYSKFTLRLSWPASSPADFSIQIYSPESLAEFISEREASFRNTDNILQSATRRNCCASENGNSGRPCSRQTKMTETPQLGVLRPYMLR